MRIGFESRLADITAAAERRHFDTSTVRRLELGFGAATSLLLASATALRISGARGLAAGAAAAVLSFFLYRAGARLLQRALIRRSWRPLYGADGRTHVEVESGIGGLRLQYGDHELQVRWAGIEDVTESGEQIAVHGTGGTLVVIPRSAFADAGALDAFVAEVRTHARR